MLRSTSTHRMVYTIGQRQKLVKMLPMCVFLTPLSNMDWLEDVVQGQGSGTTTMEISASLKLLTVFRGSVR